MDQHFRVNHLIDLAKHEDLISNQQNGRESFKASYKGQHTRSKSILISNSSVQYKEIANYIKHKHFCHN